MSASIRPPGRWIEQSWPETRWISSYSWIVYCWSRATFGSPLSVCMPPAACQVEPAVSSRRSRSIDVGPARLREVVQHAGADHASPDDDDLGR